MSKFDHGQPLSWRSSANADPATVAGFGFEWCRFDQGHLDLAERRRNFDQYFSIFPWELLPEGGGRAPISVVEVAAGRYWLLPGWTGFIW